MGSSPSGTQATVEREIVRRQQDLALAEKLAAEAEKAYKEKDYETAYVKYLQAVDLMAGGEANRSLYRRTLNRFSEVGVAYAEDLINNGRYAEAEKVAKTILLPRYNPSYKPAVQLLSNLEQPDYYNKTITPAFAAQRDEVNNLFKEAEGYYETGRYDLAIKRYNQILAIDPYNKAARMGLERVNKQQQIYYNSAYNETRSRMLWEVDQAWAQPVRKYDRAGRGIGGEEIGDIRGTERITAKLNRIIIPRIDLRDATVREAIEFLKQQSRNLDTTEDDPQQRGVNIVLNLDTGTPSAAAGVQDELPTVEGATEASVAASGDTRITLSLNQVPLGEAIRYLAQLASLKVKVEPFAVSIVPLSAASEDLITKKYKVPPGFIPQQQATNEPTAFAGSSSGEESKFRGRASARQYLESLGVTFPPGAAANYINSTSELIVKNTRDNIDLIDFLVDAALGVAPTQVNIESKFVEVTQNNLKELGFDWLLGPVAIGDNGVYGSGGTASPGMPINTSDYPFTNSAGTQPIGRHPVTGGLRSGSYAINPTSIEGVLAAQQVVSAGGTLAKAPGIFSFAGVFTNPQFQVVIRALNQKKGVDLMAAPSVTAKSGQNAVIRIVREFIYPTEFDPPQVPQSTDSATVVGVGTGGIPPQPIVVTPSIPSTFEKRDIGVTLNVTPVVGPDGYTIDLELTPEIVDFDGFINYGSPIYGVQFDPITGQPRTSNVPLTDNTINQPIFSTRRVTTNVSIWDGQTVALGGLIREDVQKVQDKVPLLGDIPLVGRAFRSDADQKIKRNLIIFVTAKIIDAEGNPLRGLPEEEEEVTPLGLPDEIAPPQMPPAKGASYGK